MNRPLAATLVAQDKQTQKTEPPQITVQPESAQTSQTEAPPAVQQPQIVVKPTTKPAQPPPTQQIITFTTEQLDEYENKILDRAETFYSVLINVILWIMATLVAIGLVFLPMGLEWYRKRSFEKEMSARLQEFKKYTEEQTEKLKKELISQIDDREAKQTIAVGSNLAYVFSALGGLFRPLEMWDMVIRSHLIAIQHSIDGQCANDCLKTSHLKDVLEKKEITNKLNLDNLESTDETLESIKVRLVLSQASIDG